MAPIDRCTKLKKKDPKMPDARQTTIPLVEDFCPCDGMELVRQRQSITARTMAATPANSSTAFPSAR